MGLRHPVPNRDGLGGSTAQREDRGTGQRTETSRSPSAPPCSPLLLTCCLARQCDFAAATPSAACAALLDQMSAAVGNVNLYNVRSRRPRPSPSADRRIVPT